MRLTAHTSSRALPALLTAAVVSIVLGILGMHALGTHGVVGDSAMTSRMTDAPAGMDRDMSAGSHNTDPTALTASSSSTAPAGGEGHDMGSMVMLCAAMLAGVAAGVLLALRMWRAVSTPVLRLNRLLPRVPALVTARLGNGPPYVWNFSVIRC